MQSVSPVPALLHSSLVCHASPMIDSTNILFLLPKQGLQWLHRCGHVCALLGNYLVKRCPYDPTLLDMHVAAQICPNR